MVITFLELGFNVDSNYVFLLETPKIYNINMKKQLIVNKLTKLRLEAKKVLQISGICKDP